MRLSTRRWDLICLGALLLLVLLFDLRLTLGRGVIITDDIGASDIANYNYPLRDLLGQFLRAGQLPLWTPLVYCGFPLAAMIEAGAWYPPNWILFGLLPPAAALNLLILTRFFLAGAFLYLYVRSVGIQPRNALPAAVAFAWCGFMVVHTKHVNMTDAAMWLPLLLFTVERYTRSGRVRWALAASAAFALQILAGHPQIAYYTFGFVLCYAAWRLLCSSRGWRQSLASWSVLVLCLLLGTGIAMVQVWPTVELARLSARSDGVSYDYAAAYAYHLPDLITFLRPYANGDPGAATYRENGIFWEDFGYVGIVPLILAAVALVAGLHRPRHGNNRGSLVLFFLAALLLSGLLMLGGATPLFRWSHELVPGMKYFRFPTRFILIVDLSLCVLAALGMQRIFSDRRGKSALLLQALILLLVSGDLFHVQKRQNGVVDRDLWETPPKSAALLRRDDSHFRILTLGAVESHQLAYQAARGWQGDLTPYIAQREFLQPSLNVRYGVASAGGLMNLVPRHVSRMWGDADRPGIIHRTMRLSNGGGSLALTPATQQILNAFGVKYVLSLWPLEAPVLTGLGRTGDAFLYRNDAALPRAYLVSAATHAPDDALERLLLEGRVSLDRQVLLGGAGTTSMEGDPRIEAGTVELGASSPGRIALKVSASHPGWLVLSETDYPGWQATMDGRPTPILRANLCARALAMPPGEHDVVFEFKPRSVSLGRLVSLTSLLLWLGWMVAASRRRPRTYCSHL